MRVGVRQIVVATEGQHRQTVALAGAKADSRLIVPITESNAGECAQDWARIAVAARQQRRAFAVGKWHLEQRPRVDQAQVDLTVHARRRRPSLAYDQRARDAA